MAKDIIKNIPLTLDINARKRLDGSIDIRLYSKDIATGQFEFTLVDEDNNPVELDETYSAQALVKYEGDSKTYLNDMIIEGNIIRFIFPHDFITKDGIVTMYIYITKDSYTSDVAAISFNVYRSEIDDVATDIVAAYDKNYEDILAEFKQTLEDYKSTLPKADSVRAEIDVVLNQFSEDSQAKLSQYDTDVQQVITDINEAETSRVEAEGQRESAETSRKVNEADRIQAESERQTNETKRQTTFETNENERDGTFSTNETVRQENETTRQQAEIQRATAESNRVSAEEQRKTDHANRSAELDGKANKKQEDWITPTLLNGAITDSDIPVMYMKDEMGFVHFKGRIKAPPGVASLRLPSGYVFSVQQGTIKRFPVLTSVTRAIADVQINYVGDVYIAATSNDVWTYLDGVSYKAGD